MPSCAGFLEPRKSILEPSKFTFNAENFLCSLSLSISTDFGEFALEMCLTARNRQKIHKKPLFWCSRSSKIIVVGANQKPVYDFRLVINSNLGLISHRFWDTATYWPKIANFLPHPSHLALSLGVIPFEFMKKLYGSWNQSLPGSLHGLWLINLCDRRTDGRTECDDRIAMAVPAFARKNQFNGWPCCLLGTMGTCRKTSECSN